jgi:hypothetical protein
MGRVLPEKLLYIFAFYRTRWFVTVSSGIRHCTTSIENCKKGETIPVTGCRGPEICEKSRLPQILDPSEVSTDAEQSEFHPVTYSVGIFCKGKIVPVLN